MHLFVKFWIGFFFCVMWSVSSGVLPAVARVSQSIQDDYKRNYENKAMFLKIPIYAQKQTVQIEGRTFRSVPDSGSPLHKVGEQMRITQVDFGGDEIKFRLAGIGSPTEAEIIFSFPVDLQENFLGRDIFDGALQSTFTEGLTYSDIEQAKTGFVKDEFERSIDQIAGATSLNRTVVLENMAPLIPGYNEMQRQRNELEVKVQDLSAQIVQMNAESLKIESKLKESESELSRIQNTNTSMQENLDGSRSQISKLEAELSNAEGRAQRFEREIQNVKSSLDTEADSNRDLTQNNVELADRIRALQTDLKEQQSTNQRLSDEIEDYKSEIRKLSSTIKTLTSNKDSIGRQYVELKEQKENLDEFVMGVNALNSRVVEEKTEDGVYSGKAEVYADNTLLGFLIWDIPSYLNYNQDKSCRATFMAESIDYVKVSPEQRQLLRTLGERLKIKMSLDALSPDMSVSTEEESESREVEERENLTWNWQIRNSSTQDVSFLLALHLVNRNEQEISLFQKEYTIANTNLIRRIRSYLKPIPLAIGIILGFLLFGIVGIFRKNKRT